MDTTDLKLFEYVEIDRKKSKTLFLLHGTGGNEHDLFPLVENVSLQYNVVGLRGNISEGGMLRFFTRDSTGKFDQESIAKEVEKLTRFLKGWYDEHTMTAKDAVFLGYSNGANMILATLFSSPEVIDSAILLHCKLPFLPKDLDLSKKSFLVTYGVADRIIPANESKEVVAKLQEMRAKVHTVQHEGGHEIREQEVEEIEKFLR